MSSQVIQHTACPDCGSVDNLAVYEDGGEHCFSPGCGRHRSGAVDAPGDELKRNNYDSLGQASPDGPPTPEPTFDTHDVTALAGRRLSQTTCETYGYARVTYEGRRYQAAPYFDRGGRPVAWKLRDRDKNFRWVGDVRRKLPLFGQQLQSHGRRVVVTEGELDALSAHQALGNRWPVVSLPDGAGSWRKAFSEALGWLDGFEQIVLCFDMDDAGRAAAEEAAAFLPAGKVHLAHLPLKDASEMVVEGRADELKRCLWNAARWSPPGIVTGSDLLPALRGKHRPPVARFPFPILDSMTRGIRAGEIILMVGASGGGKSTWCRSLVYGLVQSGIKVGVLSLEETLDMFMVPLVGYALGQNLRVTDEDPTQSEEFAAAVHDLEDRVVAYDDDGTRDPDVIFDRARYMQAALGCGVVVLDHLTVLLAAGAGEHGVATADRLMARLEAHVKKTQMTLIVVMHLRKTSEGKTFEQGRVPTMSDIRGSGLIPGFSHTIVARSRNQEENDGGHLHLLKCRLGGTGLLGEADALEYDQGTGMLRSTALPRVGPEDY